MKSLLFLSTALVSVLTTVSPVWAQDSSTSRTSLPGQESGPSSFKELNMHLNPLLGVSNLEYSGQTGGGSQRTAGGLTVELGGAARKLETGLLYLQSAADATMSNGSVAQLNATYLAIPMMAKLRILSMRSQSWFVKFGVTTALRLTRDEQNVTNAADVLAGLGLGGRFPITRNTDFVIDATYNRGLLEAVRTSKATHHNQGVLVLAGISIQI